MAEILNPFTSCLIHLGDQPPPVYYRHALEQLRVFTNDKIILVCEYLDEFQHSLIRRLNIEHIKPSTLPLIQPHRDFHAVHDLDKSFRGGFWTYVVERFFVLEELMIECGVNQILHTEGDNLIFHNVAELAERLKVHYSGIAVPFDHDQRAVAGIFFVLNKSALTLFNHFIVEMYKANPGLAINDMQLLGLFREAYPGFIDSLPVVPSNYPGKFENLRGQVSTNPGLFSNHFDDIEMIFDANALGQYIDGIDPRNTGGKVSKGFINETAMQRFDFYQFKFEKSINENLQFPILESDNCKVKIANLHIHSKNLQKFSSTQFLGFDPDKFITHNPVEIPAWDIISSERFQELADLCIADRFTYEFYTSVKQNSRINTLVIEGPRSHLQPTSEQLRKIDRATVLFVNTHILSSFVEHILPNLVKPFVLISHASDDSVDAKFLPLLADSRLIHWFAQNVRISHEKLTPIPIGLANTQFLHGNIQVFQEAMQSNIERTNLLFTCLSEKTNKGRTDKIEALRANGFNISQNLIPFCDYLKHLAKAFFVSSPEGNGMDCHRTWETLYLGAIPIVDSGSWVDEFPDLGIFQVNNWNAVTPNLLIEHLESLPSRRFDKLRLSYWKNLVQHHKLRSYG